VISTEGLDAIDLIARDLPPKICVLILDDWWSRTLEVSLRAASRRWRGLPPYQPFSL